MRRTLEVLLISGSTIYSAALQQWLETGEPPCHCRTVVGSDVVRSPLPGELDVMLIEATDWRQLALWLPPLRQTLSSWPWVILAELRLVGMFLKLMEDQPCVVVDPNGDPASLRSGLQAAAERQCHPVGDELRVRLARSLSGPPHSRPSLQFTDVELQCGCGVSLGLTNPEIGEALRVSEATVKSHLHRLMKKLETHRRREVGELIEWALSPDPPAGPDMDRKGGASPLHRYGYDGSGAGLPDGRGAGRGG